MRATTQRWLKPAIILLLVGLAMPAVALGAARLPDSPPIKHSASASPVLLERTRPAEAEHENELMVLLERMLDRRLVRAKQGARAAAYVRWLRGQVSWRADWNAMATCESSQRWHLNIGTFDGGLQFLPSTWDAYGGRRFAPYAWQATKLEQIVVASRVLRTQGPSAWPSCFRGA